MVILINIIILTLLHSMVDDLMTPAALIYNFHDHTQSLTANRSVAVVPVSLPPFLVLIIMRNRYSVLQVRGIRIRQRTEVSLMAFSV